MPFTEVIAILKLQTKHFQHSTSPICCCASRGLKLGTEELQPVPFNRRRGWEQLSDATVVPSLRQGPIPSTPFTKTIGITGQYQPQKETYFKKYSLQQKKLRIYASQLQLLISRCMLWKSTFEKSHEVPLKGHLRSNNPRHGHPVRPTPPRIPAIQGEERQDQKLSLKQLLGKWHE